MKRFGILLVVAMLLLAGCGGRSEEPAAGGQGVAALDQPDSGGGAAKDQHATDKKKDGDASKDKKTAEHKDKGGGVQGASNESDGNDGDSAPSGNAHTKSPGGSGSTHTAQATAAVPIPTGTDSYDTNGSTTVSGNKRPMPDTTTLTAKAPRSGEQAQIRDLRDSDGNGTVVESHLLYRDEGVYLTYVKITATFPGGFTDVRELQPAKPALIAPTGLGPGSNASFTMQGSGTKAAVDISAKRWENVSIGGTAVKTLVVNTRIVFSGAYEGQQLSTSWFWGKHVLAVREHVKTDVSNGPIEVHGEYEATLTRLP